MQLPLQLVLIQCLLIDSGWMGAAAQSPLEQWAANALNVGNQLMQQLQEGQVATQQMNFDTPTLGMRSKTDVGFGKAMRPPGATDDSDDSDSDESAELKRQKRDNLATRRVKRSPCKWMNQMMTESPDDVDARRRRARKRATTNNGSRSRVNKKQSNGKKKFWEQSEPTGRRRKRQTTIPDDVQQVGANIGERVKGMWLSFVDNVFDVAHQVQQSIKGVMAQAANAGAGGAGGAGGQP